MKTVCRVGLTCIFFLFQGFASRSQGKSKVPHALWDRLDWHILWLLISEPGRDRIWSSFLEHFSLPSFLLRTWSCRSAYLHWKDVLRTQSKGGGIYPGILSRHHQLQGLLQWQLQTCSIAFFQLLFFPAQGLRWNLSLATVMGGVGKTSPDDQCLSRSVISKEGPFCSFCC